MYRVIFFAVVSGLSLSSCFTPGKEERINGDIANLQTRLVRLEQSSHEKGRNFQDSDQKNKKNMAQLQTEVEKVKLDLQKILGEMDRLQVGVESGELPGSENPNSIKATLDAIMTRLETIESNQQDIIESTQKKSGSKKSSTRLNSLSAMDKAFKGKRYAHVADSAVRVLRALKTKKSKEKALYLYAESLYKLGRLREAALKYNDFIEQYSKSERIAHAKMRMGDCFRHMGDKGMAKLYYEELVNDFPNSDSAEKAKERIDGLQKSGASRSKKSRTKFARKSGAKSRS